MNKMNKHEAPQTRVEHSRSMEDAEKFRAIDTLKQVGLLIPVSELELWHGRASVKEGAEDWSVDPAFKNGGNDSGNNNVNTRPALYTSDLKTSSAFANARRADMWRDREDQFIRKSGRRFTKEESDRAAEDLGAYVHEIVTADTDAIVMDLADFKEENLSDEDRARYRQALKALAIPLTEGSPLAFDERDSFRPFVDAFKSRKRGELFSSEDAVGLATTADIDSKVALQLSSAHNARLLSEENPKNLVEKLLENPDDIITEKYRVDGEVKEIPINLEYVQRYLHDAHIVGAKQIIDSATVGREITSVSFFDLEKMQKKEDLEAKQRAFKKRFGSIAMTLVNLGDYEVTKKPPLVELLSNAYAKPQELVSAAQKVQGYDKIFEADAGNWEGYTLAEHTETVLRNFDENFADDLPVSMLSPMRLAILTHDIGKPIAAAKGDKSDQMKYNIEQADDFLDKINVEPKLKGLLLAMIGEGEELEYKAEVRHDNRAKGEMKFFANKTLQEFYDSQDVSDEQIGGFIEMCKMLQICDGGAYTSMAITRSKNGHYRNAPSFNGTFAEPHDFGRRSLHLRKQADRPADDDLTPKI